MVLCRPMRKSDVTCPKCKAGYRRIEVASGKKSKGEYRCLLCDHLLELEPSSDPPHGAPRKNYE